MPTGDRRAKSQTPVHLHLSPFGTSLLYMRKKMSLSLSVVYDFDHRGFACTPSSNGNIQSIGV